MWQIMFFFSKHFPGLPENWLNTNDFSAEKKRYPNWFIEETWVWWRFQDKSTKSQINVHCDLMGITIRNEKDWKFSPSTTVIVYGIIVNVPFIWKLFTPNGLTLKLSTMELKVNRRWKGMGKCENTMKLNWNSWQVLRL